MTDQQIISTIKSSSVKNCETALVCVYKEYYKMIENFITQNNGSREDAKDIFQEIVISLYSNIKSGKYSPDSKLSSYLFSIGKNHWFNRLRKNKRIGKLDDSGQLQVSADEDIQRKIEYSEHQKFIGKLLHKTGEDCSKLLKLFYYEKMKMVKIAATMDYSSEQEAKNKKYKCMKKLRAVVLSNDNIKEQLRNSN